MEPAWRHYQQATGELAEAMQRWREDFSELQSLSLQQLLPGLDDFALELDRRFTGMASMMGDEAARNGCADIVLEFDSVTLGSAVPLPSRGAAGGAASHVAYRGTDAGNVRKYQRH